MSLGVNISSRNNLGGPIPTKFCWHSSSKPSSRTKTAYIAELIYGGVFGVPPMAEEGLRLFLLVEAPRMLFPFARSILMGAVRDGGFPQVMIGPVDFMNLYLANKGNIGTMPAAGAA